MKFREKWENGRGDEDFGGLTSPKLNKIQAGDARCEKPKNGN